MSEEPIDLQYIRDRITTLRTAKGLSERKLSTELGHSLGYINNISKGRSLPSMAEFLYICNYFGITPEDFFQPDNRHPIIVRMLLRKLNSLSKDDLRLIKNLIHELGEKE